MDNYGYVGGGEMAVEKSVCNWSMVNCYSFWHHSICWREQCRKEDESKSIGSKTAPKIIVTPGILIVDISQAFSSYHLSAQNILLPEARDEALFIPCTKISLTGSLEKHLSVVSVLVLSIHAAIPEAYCKTKHTLP